MKPATTVEKIARILQAFASRPVLGVTEAARIAGLLPSDAHRLLQSLRAVGFVEQDSSSRKYRLGLNLLRLGNQVHRHLKIAHCARPILRDLADRTKADANAAVLDPHLMEVFFVEQIPSTEFASGPRVGATESPHATGVGKVLAAQLDRDARRALMEKPGHPKLLPPNRPLPASRVGRRWPRPADRPGSWESRSELPSCPAQSQQRGRLPAILKTKRNGRWRDPESWSTIYHAGRFMGLGDPRQRTLQPVS